MPSQSSQPWSSRRWASRKKHLRPSRKIAWEDVVKATGEKHGWARYARNLPMAIEEIELSCLENGIELPQQGLVRRFWREFAFSVGASEGEETTLVYVEWHSAGDVHGRPITRAELIRNKGLPP